jgi:hypothetical protein
MNSDTLFFDYLEVPHLLVDSGRAVDRSGLT